MTYSPDWNGPLERLERQTFPQTFRRIPCKHWPERLERLERQKKAKAGAIPAKRCRATPRRPSGQRAGCCTTPTASRLKCGSRPLPTMPRRCWPIPMRWRLNRCPKYARRQYATRYARKRRRGAARRVGTEGGRACRRATAAVGVTIFLARMGCITRLASCPTTRAWLVPAIDRTRADTMRKIAHRQNRLHSNAGAGYGQFGAVSTASICLLISENLRRCDGRKR